MVSNTLPPIDKRTNEKRTEVNPQRNVSEERRSRHYQAFRQGFRRSGYSTTTTARPGPAADVSEALLFKHFHKEALFFGNAAFVFATRRPRSVQSLMGASASASTRVLMTHFFVSRVARGLSCNEGKDGSKAAHVCGVWQRTGSLPASIDPAGARSGPRESKNAEGRREAG